MSGRDYLESIKKELEAGRHQHRMGENILAQFGYVRRRRSAVDEINKVLEQLGLRADPPISPDMPLRAPRIRFSLAGAVLQPTPPTTVASENEVEIGGDDIDTEVEALVSTETTAPSFRIAELLAADQEVAWVTPQATVAEAYTRMSLKKYSQLLVASSATPRAQDVKGIISFKSIAKASLKSKPKRVGDCLEQVPILRHDTDLDEVIKDLSTHDVVLVSGADHRIQGIVTAWDLASEFAQLVATFKRIGEVEGRLRVLLANKLGIVAIRNFLIEQSQAPAKTTVDSVDELTIGELVRVLQHSENWEQLGLSAIDKALFVQALDEVREFRNRLMHFRDPLNQDELLKLTNLCELVRELPV